MKWDVDRALEQLEGLLKSPVSNVPPGTGVTRVYAETAFAYQHGIKPRTGDDPYILLWCLSVGYLMKPKEFFYGRTIREVYLKARKALLKKPVRKRASSLPQKRASS